MKSCIKYNADKKTLIIQNVIFIMDDTYDTAINITGKPEIVVIKNCHLLQNIIPEKWYHIFKWYTFIRVLKNLGL